MAIATTMYLNINNVDISTTTNTNTNTNPNPNTINHNQLRQQMDDDQEDDDRDEDEHECDMVMPGFRFHPTEEELVEFYLRRKVDGKPFNVELISFIDLYRYDPWELPALAAIGEKEWFFYVPRDRKYRNGDRPNRVTPSGYWKATGADRMIRGERFRAIGLKKTLVFYSGKAPKGIRTSWIMHEYRLPQHDTERYQKAEISLCKVYKRAGVEDHPSVPRVPPSRLSSLSSDRKNYHTAFKAQSSSLHNQNHHCNHQIDQKVCETDARSNTEVGTALGLSHRNSYASMSPLTTPFPPLQPPNFSRSSSLTTKPTIHNHHQPRFEEIQKLVEYQQPYFNHHSQQHQQLQFENLTSNLGTYITTTATTTTTAATDSQFQLSNYLISPSQQMRLNNNPTPAVAMLPPPNGGGTALWDWNLFPEANKDHFSSLFN